MGRQTPIFHRRKTTIRWIPYLPFNSAMQYRNPVYPEYFADPFVWKHDGIYYAVGTGVVEAHSRCRSWGSCTDN